MPNNAADVLARLETAAAAASLRSNEIEDLGRLPSDIVESLIDSGVFRLWIPTKHDGYQADIQTGLQAIERASYHDGAVGWCVMIGCTTSLRSGYLPEEVATEIYGDPRAVTGGFGRPSGTGVVTADGGLRVSGQWPWGSGSSHCTWLGGGVNVVDENGEPSALPDGGQAPFVFFRRDEVDLLDSWHVAGLKGSGSTDYVVDNVDIPAGRWISMTGNAPVVDGPLYRYSHLGALAVGIASVSLGLAARAVDELIALGTKMPDASSRTLAERAPVQADLAQADVNVRAARAFVAETVAGCWAAAEVGEIGDEHRRLLRLAANNAVERSTAAVDLCYRAAGGTAVYRTSPLQRIFRDAHVATQHVMTAPRMMEPLGRMLFGLPTSTAQF
ncbi:MAG: acyl-CoA dehydrogenase family protein [Acidimicrobiales bacterium]